MRKLLTALMATVGIGVLIAGAPARAGVTVGIGVPGVAIAPPVVPFGPRIYAPYYYPPYNYGARYWHRPGYSRYGYGYGYRGYWHGHYWR